MHIQELLENDRCPRPDATFDIDISRAKNVLGAAAGSTSMPGCRLVVPCAS
jgi:hypothetical protein